MSPQPTAASPKAPLWRVGRTPEPWAWADWAYAGDQRWDDSKHEFRTVYAAENAYGCFVETLAHFRPDPAVVDELSKIHVDAADAAAFPSAQPGEVPRNWVDTRLLSSATVDGLYCDVTTAQTVAAFRPHFLTLSRQLGLADFDAAAIKSAKPRTLTQNIASWLYRAEAEPDHLWDGVNFASRHGDDLRMWAIFERPGDQPFSQRLTILTEKEIPRSHPQLRAAFELHGLRWVDPI